MTQSVPERPHLAVALRWWVVVATLVVGWMLLPLLTTVLAAVVVVMVAWPLHLRVRARLGRHHTLAVVLTMALLVLGVFGPIVLGGVVVGGEISELLPGLAEAAQGLPERASSWLDGPAAPVFRRFIGADVAPSAFVAARLQAALAPALQQAGVWLQATVNNVGAALLRAIIFLFVLGTLLHAAEALAARARSLLPFEPGVVDHLWESLSRFARGFVVAALVVAVVQGSLGGVGYALAGVERAPLWAALTGLVSVVPFVGTALVWVPLTLLELARGDLGGAALIAGWSLVVVSSVDNFVRPLVIGQAARVHPLLIFLAVFGGLATFGLSGLLVGPMLMATLLALLEQYEEAGDAGREVSSADAGGVAGGGEPPAP